MRAGCMLSAVLATACTFDVRGLGGGDDAPADASVPAWIDGAAAIDAQQPPPPPDAQVAPPDARPPDAGAPCGSSYVFAAGSWYREITDAHSWYDAEIACETDGAHLVVVLDSAENDLVSGFTSSNAVWLGLTDRVTEGAGNFRWVTGEQISWDSWNGGEPNDSWFNEDCAVLLDDGGWNDLPCNDTLPFVCECDGVPVDPGSF